MHSGAHCVSVRAFGVSRIARTPHGAASKDVDGMRPNAKPRVYTVFAQNARAKLAVRHERDTETMRERIRRPVDAAPRRVEDWQ
jgi:hypothetical protein